MTAEIVGKDTLKFCDKLRGITITCTTPQSSELPSQTNDQGVTYNRASIQIIWQVCWIFDLSLMMTALMRHHRITTKNAGNPFHRYLVR